jgi:hypothetical protein
MSHPSLLNGIMSHADVSSMMNIYLYMKPIFWFRHDFFFGGADCALGDDFDCRCDDLAYVSQKCLSKGLISLNVSSLARPLLGPSAPHVMYFAPLATALFPYAAWIRGIFEKRGIAIR